MADHRKEIAALLKIVEHQGFRIVDGNHWKVFPPNGTRMVVIAKTPSSLRSLTTIRVALKRAGAVLA